MCISQVTGRVGVGPIFSFILLLLMMNIMTVQRCGNNQKGGIVKEKS